MQWDDQWVVINNYTEQGLTLVNFWQIISEFYHGQYSPVNQLYYTFIYGINGYDAVIFHLGSLAIHCANILLIYRLNKIIFTKLLPNNPDLNYLTFLCTLIFAIHPLNVESVAWLSASKVPLYAFFYLLGLLFYFKFLEKKCLTSYLLVLVCFLTSFGAKEQAVTFPIGMLIIDLIFYARRDVTRMVYEKALFLLLSILFGIITIHSQENYGDVSTNLLSFDFTQRIVLSAFAFIEYLTKALLPVNLSYLYPFPFSYKSKIPVTLLFYPIFIITGLFLVRDIFRNKVILFSISFFVVHIAIALHLINLSRFAIIADRYAYLSLIGSSVLLTFFCAFLKQKLFWQKKRPLNFCVLLFIGYLVFLSNRRVNAWGNSETLKRNFIQLIKNRDDVSKK